ncbi:unnamed protein product [marine sediment metagenome]|uniref:Uncharacterized protein n=1 Tax=marine sediment metagenome TaxID=412755 RepID=X1GL56_9ZZZZ
MCLYHPSFLITLDKEVHQLIIVIHVMFYCQPIIRRIVYKIEKKDDDQKEKDSL